MSKVDKIDNVGLEHLIFATDLHLEYCDWGINYWKSSLVFTFVAVKSDWERCYFP